MRFWGESRKQIKRLFEDTVKQTSTYFNKGDQKTSFLKAYRKTNLALSFLLRTLSYFRLSSTSKKSTKVIFFSYPIYKIVNSMSHIIGLNISLLRGYTGFKVF